MEISKHTLLYIHLFVRYLYLITISIINLKYLKYLVWILLLVSFSWIVYDGCLIDIYHHKIEKKKFTDNVTPIIQLFNPQFADDFYNNYLKNTKRSHYISIFEIFLVYTIIIYRLIYKIDFFK